MKLNFKGFFKAAGLCSLAFALTGCITWGLVSNTASRPHAEQWRSDTIKGLSLAEDSNGTKGYVFVGESLDYLLTTGGDEVVNMLNDPAIHGERITVSDNAKFILSSSNKISLVLLRSITTGTTKKIRHWQHNMVLFVIPGVVHGCWTV